MCQATAFLTQLEADSKRPGLLSPVGLLAALKKRTLDQQRSDRRFRLELLIRAKEG